VKITLEKFPTCVSDNWYVTVSDGLSSSEELESKASGKEHTTRHGAVAAFLSDVLAMLEDEKMIGPLERSFLAAKIDKLRKGD